MQGRSDKRGASPSGGGGEKKGENRETGAFSVEKDPWLPSSSYSDSSSESVSQPRVPLSGSCQRPFAFSSRPSSHSSLPRSGNFSRSRAPDSFSSQSPHSSRSSLNASNSAARNSSVASPRPSHIPFSSRHASPFSRPSALRPSRPSRPSANTGSSSRSSSSSSSSSSSAASSPSSASSFSSSSASSSSSSQSFPRQSRRISTSPLPPVRDVSCSNSAFFSSSSPQVSPPSRTRQELRASPRSPRAASSHSRSPPARRGREEPLKSSSPTSSKKSEEGTRERTGKEAAGCSPNNPPGGHKRDDEKERRRGEERGRGGGEERGRREDERGSREEERGRGEEERGRRVEVRDRTEEQRKGRDEERGRVDGRSKYVEEEEKRRRGEERVLSRVSTGERGRSDGEENSAEKREEKKETAVKTDQDAPRERKEKETGPAREKSPGDREGRGEGRRRPGEEPRETTGKRPEHVGASVESAAGGEGAANEKKEKPSDKKSRTNRERGGRKSCEEGKGDDEPQSRMSLSSRISTREPRALAVHQWIGARLGHSFHPGKIISIRSIHSPASSLPFPNSPARRHRQQRGGRTCPSCSKYMSGDSASPVCRRCGVASTGRRSEAGELGRGVRGQAARAEASSTACGSMAAVGGLPKTPEGPPAPGEGDRERMAKGQLGREAEAPASLSRAMEIEKPHHYEYYVHYRHTNRRLDTWLKFDDLRPITPDGQVLEFPAVDRRRRRRRKRRRGEERRDTWDAEEDDAGDEAEPKRRRHDREEDAALRDVEDERDEAESSSDRDNEDEEDSDWEMLDKLAMFDPSVQFSDHDEEAAKEHEGMDLATLQAHEEATKIKTIRQIQFGPFLLQTWYFSPYPAHVQDAEVLHVCEFCLSFFRHASELSTHKQRCILRHPPGDEIYREGRLSVFEVDGSVARVYSENLCFLAKLFLDHKTLQYDVEPFLFYVLTEVDRTGCHLIGYFSKEKISLQAYNLACILTMPQHQRKGYGRFLISFSYLLSLREKKKGGPERPLSDLGRLSYIGWWTWCLLTHMESDAQKRKRKISIEDLVRNTAVREEDIQRTLEEIGVLRYVQGHHLLLLHPDLVKTRLKYVFRRRKKSV
ncbi:UNVERIFIED_CONTAM: histone lysine acetyltransferase MYST-B [Hammondia hammondi]|eukprot:XP_008888813.1 histone lysine acetyltransferase MYST-B [Hammondia hammondi]